VHLSTFSKVDSRITLEEIWYGSQGLHLIGATIQFTYLYFQKLGGTWSEPFST
jgi:hypothetical protein